MKKYILALLIMLPSAAWTQQLCPANTYNFNGQCLDNPPGVAVIGGQTGTGASGKGGGLTLRPGKPTGASTATGDVILFSDPSNAAVNFKCSQPTAGNTGTATCALTNMTLAGGGSGTVTSVALTVPGGLSVSGSPVTTSGTLAITTALSGPIKGTGSALAAAAAADIVGLFSTCSGIQYLGADGACHTAGGGGVAVPGTIPDLVFWYESDNIVATAGRSVSLVNNRTPWITGIAAAANTIGSGPTLGAAQLNSLNVLTWGASAAGRMTITEPYILTQVTVFVVARPSASSPPAAQAILGGSSPTALELDLQASGGGALTLTDSATTVIGTSSATWTGGVAFQANVTYNSSTGVFAFRQSQASAGSGTNAQTIGATSNEMGYTGAAASDLKADLPLLIIYNRVLSGGEITTVEAYINSKWGV